MNNKPHILIELITAILILSVFSFMACDADWNTSDVGFGPEINLTKE